MNRQERSHGRKMRRRMVTFSLSLCLLVFLGGVHTTNRVMMEMMALPEEQNLLSFRHIGQTLTANQTWHVELIRTLERLVEAALELVSRI